ncbi:VPLPA-CTERM sorting domain-containing protein [Poseidonocella sedimentorum]|uniref:VPLPA-CTERM protein sorting domain-containing protein n=1 Tax=Poseidonocella sedimentorum TaxID=871652 RepID=A0A1I6E8S8_9RHOB|nr:VPLPA-CTERM sorting domain-containing protein [Poseidonocella sedimentorum]SFR14135.1 VPLPA-CTERM protein sorting domain-containing protein [Poseidonocella sedimentorum]
MRHVLTLFITILGLALPPAASAATTELTITGLWTAADYDVSSALYGDDDLVFGTSPSRGSLSFTLLVDTSSPTVFPSGTAGVTHDWYGYSSVTLKSTVTFGTATFTAASAITDLDGPSGSSAKLWTDTDITTADPTRLSFRIQGSWPGGAADAFFGSRTTASIGDQFLLWEYFDGEEIRSSSYTASAAAVPLPAGGLLLLTALAGLTAARRKRV